MSWRQDLQARWSGLPAWVRWPVGIAGCAALYAVGQLAAGLIVGFEGSRQGLRNVIIIVGFVVVTAVLTLRSPVSRRRFRERQAMAGTIRSGALDPSLDLDAVLVSLERQIRFQREMRVVMRGFWLLVGALAVFIVVVPLVRGEPAATWVPFAVVMLVVAPSAWWMDWYSGRTIRRLESRRADLRRD